MGGKNYRSSWVRSLLNRCLYPSLNIIEVISPGSDWQQAERAWIKRLRLAGCRLVNHTDGGEGNRGGVASLETRLKMSITQRGKRWSPEKRLKMVAALTGKKWTESRREAARIQRKGMNSGPKSASHLQNISRALTGRKLSESHVDKMRARKISEETRHKLRLSHTGVTQSQECKRKRSEAMKITLAKKKAAGTLFGRKKSEDEKSRIAFSITQIWAKRRAGLLPLPRRGD